MSILMIFKTSTNTYWEWRWKGKDTVHPITGHKSPKGEYRYSSTLTLTSAIDGSVQSVPRLGHFTPRKDPVPIVYEARWAPGPVWMGAENLTPTGIWSLDHPARSESLYWLSYPGPYTQNEDRQKLKYAAGTRIFCMTEKKKYLELLRGLVTISLGTVS
jgi:hypothetical protein